MKEAGISEIGFDTVQPTFHTGAGKWVDYYTLGKIGAAIMKQKPATEQELQQILSELKTFTEYKNSIVSLPRVFRVWGRRSV